MCRKRMEEQFILRVPPSVAERIERLLNESTTDDKSLDLSFSGIRYGIFFVLVFFLISRYLIWLFCCSLMQMMGEGERSL